MANLIPNLQTFLNGVDVYVEKRTEKDGKLILKMKPSVLATPDSYKEFLQTVNPLKKKLRLEYYIEHKSSLKPAEVVNETNKAFPFISVIEFYIDVAALHADRLKDYFQNGTSKEDITESINLLLQMGWTENDFQKIGIPHTAYFSYAPESGKVSQAAPSLENQPISSESQAS